MNGIQKNGPNIEQYFHIVVKGKGQHRALNQSEMDTIKKSTHYKCIFGEQVLEPDG